MSNMSTPDIPPECMNCSSIWIEWIIRFLKPSTTIIHVERYVILAAALLLVLSLLGTWRCRSRNLVVQYGVKGVYLLSVPLLSYTMGLMQGVIKNELFPVWAVFLVVLFGGTNSVSVQRLDENKQWAKVAFETILYAGYVSGVSSTFIDPPGSKVVYSSLRYGALLFMVYLIGEKVADRVVALVLASDHRNSGSLKVARHMTELFNQPLSPYDPRSMQGYRYIVFPFLPDIPGSVTLDEIWCHGNGVLAMDDDSAVGYLKDLCLSFALFRLTVRRYFGYSCPESGLDMTRDLVLQGLLPRGEDDYGRAFQVIEVELAFIYDFFFTKYAAITFRGVKHFLALSLSVTIIIMVFGTYVLTHLNGDATLTEKVKRFQDSGLVSTNSRDILVTKLILYTFVVFQLLQIWLYCVSDWAKLSLICKHLSPSGQTNTYIKKLLLLMGQVSVFLEQRRWFHHWRWENKMGQYLFLDSFRYPRYQFLERCSNWIPMFREGRKGGKSISVPVEVKKAIARTLKDSNGQITNGASALQRHGMTDDLYWSCQTNGRITLAHVIMIWHIATNYCDQVMNKTDAMPARLQTSHFVATSLSKYCAYLVAFVPELVPGNSLETENMLDDLVFEARRVFSTASDKCGRLRELQDQGIEGGVLAKGAILGVQLESIVNQGTRWELLADFWAELMLYIAPSDNVSGHIECLAQGGEFITHVWALLMHAGILERPDAGAA